MQEVIKNFKEDFKKFNIISKYILKFVTPLIIGLIFAAALCRVMLVNGMYFNSLPRLYDEMLICLKESFGAVFLGAYFLQFLYMASQK